MIGKKGDLLLIFKSTVDIEYTFCLYIYLPFIYHLPTLCQPYNAVMGQVYRWCVIIWYIWIIQTKYLHFIYVLSAIYGPFHLWSSHLCYHERCHQQMSWPSSNELAKFKYFNIWGASTELATFRFQFLSIVL